MKNRNAVVAGLAVAVLSGCSAEISQEMNTPEGVESSVLNDEQFCEGLVAIDESEPPEQGGNSADELAALADVAPEEWLREDTEVVATYHREVYTEGDGDTDTFENFPTEVQEAASRVHEYGVEHCGLPE